MASWRRRIAEALSAPGSTGPWSRRIAEGATAVGGSPVGTRGVTGSHFRRLAEGAGLTGGIAGWARRLADGAEGRGSWDRTLAEDAVFTEISLGDVTLSANSLPENSAQGTVIGAVQGAHAGATLSLVDTGGGKAQLSGATLSAGATGADYETATSFNVTVRQTLAGALNSPRDTVLTVNVTNVDDTAPTITSSASPSVAENAHLAHALTANESVTWAIRTSAQNAASVDYAQFELSGSTLRWAGDGTKDFEAPDDTGSNNTYVVVVRATDAANNTADQTITVTVTDEEEELPFYPQSATGLNYKTYPAGPTALPVTVTAAGSANAKGSYAELCAATDFACNMVIVEISGLTLAGRGYLLDIAVGGAGSEQVVIPNIIAESQSTSSTVGATSVAFPLAIAAGARVSARVQATSASATLRVGITIIKAGDTPGCAAFTAHGADTATSLGVSVDPGGVGDTKGAYAEIVASTPALAQYMVLMVSGGANGSPTACTWAADLATGAAASEVPLLPDLRFSASSVACTMGGKAFAMPTYIPASTRLSMRASCNITDATDRVFRAVLYTATAPA